jgi:hypothetical protein
MELLRYACVGRWKSGRDQMGFFLKSCMCGIGELGCRGVILFRWVLDSGDAADEVRRDRWRCGAGLFVERGEET